MITDKQTTNRNSFNWKNNLKNTVAQTQRPIELVTELNVLK